MTVQNLSGLIIIIIGDKMEMDLPHDDSNNNKLIIII